jgi:putative heme-binding domain-containing protein
VADNIASLLPADQARDVRKTLSEYSVRILRVGTVPDQMLYDKERLVIQAGKPFEVVFENSDLMPHNFVIVQPGALEEVGNQAEATGTQPGAVERHYVPPSNKVLIKSKLLSPRATERISVDEARSLRKPGVYPYVCTYPGHWRRMYGALYVVDDLEAYQADPEGYLVKHNIIAQDELLKLNRPRKEWKYDELAGEMAKLKNGRSFANGRQMFTVANCIACHKFGGVGQEIGPDLTKLDPKQQPPVEVWRDIVEPSYRIHEKFQSWQIEMKDGKQYTGLILEEKDDVVKLLENPLAKAEPLQLKKADIEAREKSPKSIMPTGLLDKLTKDEILDLVAYIASKGDPKSPLFQGGHDHGHDHK